MKKLYLACLFLAVGSFVSAQTKEEDILHLLEISNSQNIAMMVVDGLIPQFKQLAPEVPEEYWERIRVAINPMELMGKIVAIYDKYFTQEEVKQMIAYYESDIGKKSVQVMPAMTEESIQIGQTWGMELAEEIVGDLMAQGYISF